MQPNVYLAALEGNWWKIKSYPWQDQVTPMQNTVLHVHVEKSPKEGSICKNFIQEVLNDEIAASLLWHQNANGEIPLHLAARFGHATAVEIFLQRAGGDEVRMMLSTINLINDTALHEAARGGNDQVVESLVRADRDVPYEPNAAGETPLYLAAESGSTASVISILKTSTPGYNHRGPCGRTALHAAILWGTPEMVQKILEKGESLGQSPLVTIQDNRGQTPIHCAAVTETKIELLQVLLSYDRKCSDQSALYIRDNEGRTPLHIATLHSNWTAMKELISSRPDSIEIADNKGQNVVHYAANWPCPIKLRNFLKLGHFSKLMNQKDMDGNTPFHLFADSFPYATCRCQVFAPSLMEDQRQYLKAFNNHNLTAGDILCSHSNQDKFTKRAVEVAPRGWRTQKERTLEEAKTVAIDVRNNRMANLKEALQSRIVVAALIATVAFTAGFTIPGGFGQDPNSVSYGRAVLSGIPVFTLFIVADATAFTCSSLAVLLYFLLPSVVEQSSYLVTSRAAYFFNFVSIGAMMAAFVLGVAIVVSPNLVPSIWTLAIPAIFVMYYVIQALRELAAGVASLRTNHCNSRDLPV